MYLLYPSPDPSSFTAHPSPFSSLIPHHSLLISYSSLTLTLHPPFLPSLIPHPSLISYSHPSPPFLPSLIPHLSPLRYPSPLIPPSVIAHPLPPSSSPSPPPTLQLLPVSKQEQFRSVLQDYFSSVHSFLAKEHKAMHKRERQNYQILTSKGEISEARRQENEAAQKLYDKLLSNASTLAVSTQRLRG